MSNELARLEAQGTPIAMAIIGAGQMGRGMTTQVVHMKGMMPAILVDRQLDKARQVLLNAGVPADEIKLAKTGGEACDLIRAGKFVIAEDARVAVECDAIPCVVDATGDTEMGARLAVETIKAHKHIVMLNVETDVAVGPLLYKMAKEEGVIYTGSAGDEPGAVMELYDFATSIGLEVLALGKGKNNKVDLSITPEAAREEALRRGMNPKMLTAFKDGTKTMVEMTAMSNATGFLPAFTNGSGHQAAVSELDKLYRLKSEGGILDRYQVVDYINGVAPGVFAIVTSPLAEVRHEITYLQVGDGPNYTLFRPFHLASLETPLSVARIVRYGIPSIVPKLGAPFSETTTIAKKDLQPGEYLDGIGGCTVYGGFMAFGEAKAQNALPIGLVNPNIRMKVAAKKGQLITYDMVQLDESSYILGLRRRQDKLLAEGKLVW